jgi:hypothetical protein
MPSQIQPVIATQLQAAGYCGLSTGALAANISSGVTLGAWVTDLLNRTASSIVDYISYDYTYQQICTVTFDGNNLPWINVVQPFGQLLSCYSWDKMTPSIAPANEGTNFSNNGKDTLTIARTDGTIFTRHTTYQIIYQQPVDPILGAWPLPILQIQLEMIQMIIKDSANDQGMLSIEERESNIGRPIKLTKDNMKRFHAALRPYVRFA